MLQGIALKVSFILVSYDKLPVAPAVGLYCLFLNMLRIFCKNVDVGNLKSYQEFHSFSFTDIEN